MKYKDFYSHLFEKYDTVGELLSDPINNETQLRDILKDFEAHGGELLGQGKYATVLSHPSWKYTLKIFSDDIPQLKFIRFTLKNPRPSFPKFYDKPRRIIPNYTRHKNSTYLYIIKTERLSPITIREYDNIQYYLYYNKEQSKMIDHTEHEFIYKKMVKLEEDFPSLPQFKKDYKFLMDNFTEGAPDIHKNNIMKRQDGSYVLNDPFWAGETPYQAYDRLLKAEIGYDGDEYDTNSDMVRGGEKHKTPKLKKSNKNVTWKASVEDNIPF